ncbi:class I SAM-dependent rRNA methyltransferase, partial [bacterium]
MSKIVLKSGKEDSIKRFHPWVFSGAINFKEEIPDGEVVEVYSSSREYLGTGMYNSGTIAVRIYSNEKTNLDEDFWVAKIQRAYNYRKNLGLIDNTQTNAYRLIHAEGDNLPGLIVDIYNDTAVMQAHTTGVHKYREEIAKAIYKVYQGKVTTVFDKSEKTLHKSEISSNSYLIGEPKKECIVKENGHQFVINWEEGQKTGFFLDQRDNRKLLGEYSKDRSVLNTFCYTGGFSVYALNSGATHVDSVDASKKAIELTDKNIELNNFTENHNSYSEDVFNFFKNHEMSYDIIVLDPPAFAKHKSARHSAIMGYKRLNTEAMKRIKPNGILFTFSCSQVVDKYLFDSTIMSAAIQAGRSVKVMHHLSQPADHPVSIFHTEGEYLKGLVLY